MTESEVFVKAIRRRLAEDSREPLAPIVGDLRPEHLAELIRELPDNEVYDAWELLHAELPSLAVEVLPLLDRHDVTRVVGELTDEKIADVLEEMPSDDATYVLELMPEERVQPVVEAMQASEGADVRRRMEFPEGSAGRLMSDAFIALPADATAADAVRRVQEASDEVNVAYAYLVDEENRLRGVVPLRRLLQVKPDRVLMEISPEDLVTVSVLDHQEHVAQIVARHDFVAVPVLDEAGRLTGVVTHDDVLDVLREEATEDMLTMAGTSADDVISESVWNSARVRMPWLLACLAGQLVGIKVLHASEIKLGPAFLTLALFGPAIVAMGGNVGTQAATIVVRGLATGRIRRHDGLPLLWREVRTAALMAVVYGLVLAGVAGFVLDKPAVFCAVVGLGLMTSMTLAAVFGTAVPIALHALRVDPAVATGPFVTTAMDVLGTGSYLALAAWVLV